MKREQTEMYSQVAFSYDAIGPQESSATTAAIQEPEESDLTPFTPSVRLDLPADMEFPTTLKLNQIIEKTAKFISSQGLQMEILLKTKQASNPQFNFFNIDGKYNGYYKVRLIGVVTESCSVSFDNSKLISFFPFLSARLINDEKRDIPVGRQK